MPNRFLPCILLLLIAALAAAGCTAAPALGPAPTAAGEATATLPAQAITPAPAVTLAPRATATPSEPAGGVLHGHVSIGPLRGGPVSADDVNAPAPPEVYAEHPVLIYAANGETLLQQVSLDTAGDYALTLAPGDYVVSIALPGRERSGDVPAAVKINAGAITTLNITIDTGLR